MWKCKHCKLEFNFDRRSEKANHSRWCIENPKKVEYRNNKTGIEAMKNSKKISGFSNQYSKAKILGYKIEMSEDTKKKIGEKSKLLRHAEETKQLIREKALKSSHRRLKKHVIDYVRKDSSMIKLDSSWEFALAKRLDYLDIVWSRPEPIKYVGEDAKEHNYFPDFHLKNFDVYLDPKNPLVLERSLKKIENIRKVIPNLIILKSLEECKEFSIGWTRALEVCDGVRIPPDVPNLYKVI